MMVNQGTEIGVRGRNVSPYWAFFIKSEGDASWVRKESTKRTCKVPTWCLTTPTQWEASSITPGSRPSFRKMPSFAREKIVAGANANLRGKVSERGMLVKRMKSQSAMDLKRAEARASRLIGKLKAKSEYDVQVAKQVGDAEANFWRKRALSAENRVEWAEANVKRLKVQVANLKEGSMGLKSKLKGTKEQLEGSS